MLGLGIGSAHIVTWYPILDHWLGDFTGVTWRRSRFARGIHRKQRLLVANIAVSTTYAVADTPISNFSLSLPVLVNYTPDPRQRRKHGIDFRRPYDFGEPRDFRRQIDDGLFAELSPGSSQVDASASSVLWVRTQLDQPLALKPGQRVRHAVLRNLEGACKIARGLAIAEADEMVEDAEMRLRHAGGQPAFHDRSGELRNDTDLIEKLEDGRTREVCPACGRVHYEHRKVSAAVRIVVDGKLLLVQRGIEPWKGSWYMPAGYLEVDEDPKTCAAREVLEETGFKVNVNDLIGIYVYEDDPRGNGIVLLYAGEIYGGSIQANPEMIQVRFFTPKEALELPKAGAGGFKQIEDWVEEVTANSEVLK